MRSGRHPVHIPVTERYPNLYAVSLKFRTRSFQPCRRMKRVIGELDRTRRPPQHGGSVSPAAPDVEERRVSVETVNKALALARRTEAELGFQGDGALRNSRLASCRPPGAVDDGQLVSGMRPSMLRQAAVS
jgi:hypothetical protein